MASIIPRLNFWGLSPALDLTKITTTSDITGERHYLLLESHDGRHLLKTMSNLSKESSSFLNFYVGERSCYTIARQLLFLSIWEEIGGEEQSPLQIADEFLELFGNTLIRPSTNDLLRRHCNRLFEAIVGDWKNSFPFISLEDLKQQDIDIIAEILSCWKKQNSIPDIKKLWNLRLRDNLKFRYDSRHGVYDLDYNMSLVTEPTCCGMISGSRYAEWRETGVAFRRVESRYSVVNHTLLSFLKKPALASHIYLGDIETSPYIAFGIESDDDSLLNKINDRYEKTSEAISFFNVLKLMCDFKKNVGGDIGNLVRINFLLLNDFKKASVGQKMSKKFDCIYLSHDSIHMGSFVIPEMLKSGGDVMVETAKYIVGWSNDRKTMYLESSIRNMAKCVGFKKVEGPCSHITYLKEGIEPSIT